MTETILLLKTKDTYILDSRTLSCLQSADSKALASSNMFSGIIMTLVKVRTFLSF